jgi:hypothetical protein
MNIELKPDYGSSGIFDLDQAAYIPLEKLHISDKIRSAFDDWNKEFQATLDRSYPPDSGFNNSEHLSSFNKTGIELAKLIKANLGSDVKVRYEELDDDYLKRV